MADMIEHWSVTTPSGHTRQIHLDNGTVRSGEQRAWVRCPRPGHSACFKYRQLNQFTSVQKCICWLGAWASGGEGNRCPTKSGHRYFVPDPALVDALE
eukprot:5464023-Alexandrium_andersonii.AAC.1